MMAPTNENKYHNISSEFEVMKLSDFSEHRVKVFSLYGKQQSDVKTDIEILRKWILQVPHLPSDIIQDEFLELCLLNNKFSLEKCKNKIEMYCTLKADPHYDYVYESIPVPSKEAALTMAIPMITAEYKRLFFFKIFDERAFEMAKYFSANTFMREFLLRNDYNDGEIHIIDLRNCSTSLVSKFRLNVYADLNKLLLQGFSARISSLHVVSKTGKTLFSTIMPLLSKKLLGRLHFHEDENSLKEIVPAKYLPSDYGGDLKSLDEFRAEWDEIFQDNRKNLEIFSNTKSREELRLDDGSRREELQGTFKKLSID